MYWLLLSILFLTVLPWYRAYRASRQTSLRHALIWFLAAWLGWGWLALIGDAAEAGRYVVLALSACAAVAVLGARRPHVAAWNFVVVGLLLVMILPLLEGWFVGARGVGTLRNVFLAAVLAAGVANYLPTRLGSVAFVAGLACGVEFASLLMGSDTDDTLTEMEHGWLSTWLAMSRSGMLLTPWLALVCWHRRPQRDTIDRLWLDFRDRYGALWALRVKEMFDQAARNAGYGVALGWNGLTGNVTPESEASSLALLESLLKRFGGAATT